MTLSNPSEAGFEMEVESAAADENVEREVLSLDEDGVPAFWVNTYSDGRVTINDCNTETPLGENETVENAFAQWLALSA